LPSNFEEKTLSESFHEEDNMRDSLVRLRVLPIVALFVAPLLASSPALGATNTTSVPLTCVSTAPPSTGGTLTVDTTVPSPVPQGSTFVLEVTPSGFFTIPAPYPGTISASWTLSASSGATPSGQFVLSLPPQHFNQGQMSPFGTFPSSFVASGPVGTMIDFQFLQFEYTITPDPGPASFTVTCVPTTTPGPIVATTTISAAGCNGRSATITGTPGDDVIVGTSRADVIDAQGGSDTIRSLSGEDVICAGDGDDTIDAGSGHDTVAAGAGADSVDGGSGNDHLLGEADNDSLRGGSGNDDLDGGAHAAAPGDMCDGGSGSDVATACEVVTAVP
jgi:RTX calcium-binding nonapeptide repeat (4 copies)